MSIAAARVVVVLASIDIVMMITAALVQNGVAARKPTKLACFRATKIFFWILTLVLSMVVYSLVINGAVFRLFGGVGWGLYLLGGGSMYLPRLGILGMEFSADQFIAVVYNLIGAAFLTSALLLWRISNSPFGQAVQGNPGQPCASGIYWNSGAAVSMVRVRYIRTFHGSCRRPIWTTGAPNHA